MKKGENLVAPMALLVSTSMMMAMILFRDDGDIRQYRAYTSTPVLAANG